MAANWESFRAAVKAKDVYIVGVEDGVLDDLLELAEYADHDSWRCEYRTRYKRCVCGLDELLKRLGMPPRLPDDPEAKK